MWECVKAARTPRSAWRKASENLLTKWKEGECKSGRINPPRLNAPLYTITFARNNLYFLCTWYVNCTQVTLPLGYLLIARISVGDNPGWVSGNGWRPHSNRTPQWWQKIQHQYVCTRCENGIGEQRPWNARWRDIIYSGVAYLGYYVTFMWLMPYSINSTVLIV